MKYKIGDKIYYIGNNISYVGELYSEFVIEDVYEIMNYYRIRKTGQLWRIWAERIDYIDNTKQPTCDRDFIGISSSELRSIKINSIVC
jgi:hypothetical protein